ncbi:MAG: winged helix DNA-binding protein [Bacilli bacterium]|jgi:DNA-binding MarR family transcriptional regulator|nr:winged helix DNA-binding protein [Bacilli bacterium]
MYSKTEPKPLGAELRETSNAVKNYIDNYLQTHLSENLTGIEGMTVGYIFHHSDQAITAKDIMGRSKVSKATMSQTLSSLERKGFIKMEPKKDDKRVKIIVLTDKGQKANEEFRSLFSQINKQIEQGLSDEEMAKMRKTMEKIRLNLCPVNDKEQ